MSFFTPTAEEIKDASTGGLPTFKNNEEVSFLINEVSETVKDGNALLIVGTKLVGGENDGRKYSHFIRENATSKGIWISMLKAFFDDATIASGTLTPMSLVGKTMKSTAKLSAKDGKEYTNFYEFSEVGGVPELGQAPVIDASDIPF